MANSNLQYENLLDLAAALSQQNDYDEVLRLVAQQAASLLQAEVALPLMINPQTRETVKTMVRQGQREDLRQFRLAQDQVTGWLARSNQSLISADLKSDPRFTKVKFGKTPVKSAIAVLLKIEGVIIGSLVLLNKADGSAFETGDLAYLEKLAVIAAPYLRNVQKLRQYFELALPEEVLLQKYKGIGLLGKSEPFRRMLHTIEPAARCDVRVLLEGESGTGKELVARAIHKFSPRHAAPFVAIDCGAIPKHLIESELFGHVRGAFTGATADRKGLLEEASSGTLFLDEIANLPEDMQAKFMRVLQEGEIRPVGSNRKRKIDVRIISASSTALRKLVEAQQFREDLFYRLHVYPVQIPSLNQRRDDIPMLADCLLKKFAQQQEKKASAFHEELVDFMKQRDWQGNIRELENFIERLVTLADPEAVTITPSMLPAEVQVELQQSRLRIDNRHVRQSLAESVAEHEAQRIRQALAANDGNQSRAARALKLPVQTLRYKMEKLGISGRKR